VTSATGSKPGPQLDRALHSLLPDGVAGFASADAAHARLLPEERDAAAGMGAARRAEFALGRSCARAALQRLDEAEHAIPRGPDRAPRWPPGITGSISHTEGLCIAVVARRPGIRALGVDVEARAPRHPRSLERIATPAERTQLEALARSAPEIDWAKLLFSAKESVYKAQYPLAGIALGFQDVELHFEPGGHFTAEIGSKVPEEHRARGAGRFVCAEGFALTLFVVRPSPSY
jgi:4'-phosphopantetheinyl transferase EntD